MARVGNLLIAGLALVGSARASPPQQTCATVRACVAEAEKDPAAFTPTLARALEGLAGSVLAEGLRYHHPLPRVDERIRPLVRAALLEAKGHSPESARLVLEAARAMKGSWRAQQLHLLGIDEQGWATLASAIGKEPDRAWNFELHFALVRSLVSRASLGQFDPRVDPEVEAFARRELSVKARADLDASLAALWERYVSSRNSGSEETRTVGSALARWPTYRARMAEFVRVDLEKQVVDLVEFRRIAEISANDPRLARQLLDWIEAAPAPLQHALISLAVAEFEHAVRGAPEFFSVPDRARIRALVIAAVPRMAQRRDELLAALRAFLERVMSDEEAESIARIADGSGPVGDMLMLGLAEERAQYRAPYLARLLGPDLEAAASVIELPPRKKKWMAEAAFAWLREQGPEDLRSEETQERFIVLEPLLRPSGLVGLPPTRRAHPESGGYHCYGGPMRARQQAVDERKDLEAFGKALPAQTPEELVPNAGVPGHFEERDVPAAPPLSEKEAIIRWQTFVLAREILLESRARP